MDKLLIVNNNLKIGGVQKSLINLIKEIHNRYDITLFLFEQQDSDRSLLPENIRIVYGCRAFRYFSCSLEELKGSRREIAGKAVLALIARVFGNGTAIRICLLGQKGLGEYDYAVSYLHGATPHGLYGGCNEVVLRKSKARLKVGFLHCDFRLSGIDSAYNRKIYNQFDRIAAVSCGCRDSFLEAVPENRNKTCCVTNCYDMKEIIQMSSCSPIEYDSDFFNIVTVCRLSSEKGLERAIQAIHQLNLNHRIKYHIVGDGSQRNKLKQLVLDMGMESKIRFYGNQTNPYGYMKNADLFLLTSYHEAAPMVFEEAKRLGLPILATKTTSTKEMIVDADAGWVCDNSTEGVHSLLEYVLQNKQELSRVRCCLMNRQYNNETAVRQFEQMLHKG